MRRAASAQRLAHERILAPLGLSPPQFMLMSAIHEAPGVSNAEIARLEKLTPPTVHVIISNLERKGLVKRRVSARHGRIQELELTPEGAELRRHGAEALAPYVARVLSVGSSSPIVAVRDWLHAVTGIDV